MRKTIFDYLKQQLITLTNLEKPQIEKLIDVLTQNEGNISLKKFQETSGLTDKESIEIHAAISSLAHSISHHKESTKEMSENSNVNKEVINKTLDFINKLNEKTLKGLDRFYESRVSVQNEKYIVETVEDDFFLKNVYNDQNESLGLIPIIRVKLHLMRTKKEENPTLNFTLDTLKIFIDSLNNIYEYNKKLINTNKGKLDNMITGDE